MQASSYEAYKYFHPNAQAPTHEPHVSPLIGRIAGPLPYTDLLFIIITVFA